MDRAQITGRGCAVNVWNVFEMMGRVQTIQQSTVGDSIIKQYNVATSSTGNLAVRG